MKTRKLFAGVVVAGLALVLLMSLNVGAQGREAPPAPPAPQSALAATGVVTSAFSYQGVLNENDEPVSGDREMNFGLYADPGCTLDVDTPLTYTVTVSEGVFSVPLGFDPAVFDGRALWLQTFVAGTPMGCQLIQAVPYANSLRPGAIISGPVGSEASLVHVRSEDHIFDRGVLGAQIGHRTSLGYPVGVVGYAYEFGSVGVWGISDSEYGWGVNGMAWGKDSIGVRGISDAITTTTYGVYGEAASPSGYGGYFENRIASGDAGWGLAAVGLHGAVITGTSGTGLYAYGSGDSPIGDDGVRGTHAGGDGVVGVSEGADDLDNGVIGFSAGGYGVYGFSNGTGQYGGYFDDPVFVNGGCTGCTLRYIARNTSERPLQIGDLVRAAGVDASLAGAQTPVMRVTPAARGDAVLGVVVGRTEMTLVEAATDDVQPGPHYGPVGGPAAPGDYLVIVVQGMAQVRIDPAAEIATGDRVAAGAAGAIPAEGAASLGMVLDAADGEGLAWVLVGLD
jgi:hypothetical protein